MRMSVTPTVQIRAASVGRKRRASRTIGGIGNDDDDDGPGERRQKRLEDQEHEVRQDRDDAVKKHRAQAFLRGLFCAQWFSLFTGPPGD